MALNRAFLDPESREKLVYRGFQGGFAAWLGYPQVIHSKKIFPSASTEVIGLYTLFTGNVDNYVETSCHVWSRVRIVGSDRNRCALMRLGERVAAV